MIVLVQDFLHTRTDRLIASGRVALAAFSLAAVWIEQGQPTGAPDLAYGLLVAYLAFAGAILVASRRERVHSAEIALVSHLIDLAVFSILMFLTEGPTSPFFPLFTFSLLSATFRWQWKGALWTAIAVLILVIAIAAIYRELAPGVTFEVERIMTRAAQVAVIGAMLVYFGFRQQHAAEETARLASWQPDPAIGVNSLSLLEACLAHVANVFAAPRSVLVLQAQGEPWANVSVWENGRFHQERLSGGSLETIVPEALVHSGFVRREAGDVMVGDGQGRLSLWHGPLLGTAMAGYNLERLLSVPIHSTHMTGRLFVADKQDFAREELTIASLVAVQIGVLLDRLQVIEAAQQATATEERLRLARDLHDGILQTLAGTALQLETIRRLAEQNPAALPAKINDMQSWLLNEQREMRGFIGKLRPAGPWARAAAATDNPDLQTLTRALAQQWGVAIALNAEAAGLVLPVDVEFDVRHIVREAVANAVRHGGATEIRVRAELGEPGLMLTISDNGRGLPVDGRFDERHGAKDRIGPRSLRERIVGHGGSLLIDSTAAGVTLSIELPLRSSDDADNDHSGRR